MNILSWFRRNQPPPHEQKESAFGTLISAWQVGQPVWTPRDYQQISEEAYTHNAISFKCTKMIAQGAASTSWRLTRKNKSEIQEHPLLDLLHRPNPVNGGSALFEAFFAYLLLNGNSFLEAVGPFEGTREPKEIYVHRPDRVQVIPGRNGFPQAFEYTANGQAKKISVNYVTGRSAMLHVKEFHPINDWYGLGRVEAAAYAIDRHNAASRHNKALLDNGASPSGALVMQPVKTGEGSYQFAPKQVIEEAKKELDGIHSGPMNAGRTMVLGGNVDWKPFGMTPRDMDFGESKDDAARDICTAFGVPHILIVPGNATYNNIREAKLELWEETIIPMLEMAMGELNNWLVPMFDERLALSVDLDSVSALEPRREMKRRSTVELLDKGVIDADEAREALQYCKRKDGAIQGVDASLVKALLDGVDVSGYEPLIRYFKSVGLYDKNMTNENLELFANSLLSDDEETIDQSGDTEIDGGAGNDIDA